MPMAVQPQQSNPMAIAGMVLGLVGLVFCWVPYFGIIVAIIGLVLSIVGVVKANSAGGTNRGMAITGLVCSIVGIIIAAALISAVGYLLS